MSADLMVRNQVITQIGVVAKPRVSRQELLEVMRFCNTLDVENEECEMEERGKKYILLQISYCCVTD